MFLKILRFLINKYVISIIVFAVIIIFLDNYSLVRQYHLKKQLEGIYEMQQHYRIQIDQNRKEMDELMTDRETLEKFAREQFLMKRDSEVIYMVIRE